VDQGGPDGGEVELVDWKTGMQLEPLPGGLDQLGIYALALRRLGQLPADGCLATYCYLGGEEPLTDSRRLGPAELDRHHALLEATLAALAGGDYDRACHRPDCDTCRRSDHPAES
jgi:RecB family exonuclease